MKKYSQPILDLILTLAGALAIGAVVSAFSVGSFWQGWLAAGVISWLVLFLLVRLWRGLGASKPLAALILTAFILRVALGIYIYTALPAVGYDTDVQNAGFVYSDAFTRDQVAFRIGAGDGSLFESFTNPESADQYGGLLFLTAVIYRFLSPDAARPLMVTLLAAFAMAAGAAFLYDAVRKRWSAGIALLTGWIFVLFPDGVLLASSQMREPFLISLACIGFWAVLQWRQKPVKAALLPLLCMAVGCVISIPAGLVLTAILAAILIIDWSASQEDRHRKAAGLAVLALLGAAAVVGGWMWLKDTLYYDAYTTTLASGWITKLIERYGQQWNIPFVTVYGLTQPVLPAAVFEPSLPIWVTIAVLRGLGWYLALPFLLFGLFASFKSEPKESRWTLVMLFVVFLVWVVVSSARAGGDQWDNPRYRYILLPFMSLILAWAIEQYRQTRSPWLWRWAACVGVFLAFFTWFYATRYLIGDIPSMPFLTMIILIVIIDGILLFGSILWDRYRSIRKAG